jgi:FKBP-type peptidyl-prolyl cis-trans isomerase FklB
MRVRNLSAALIIASVFGASSSFARSANKNAQSSSATATAQATGPALTLSNSSQQADTQPVDINKVSFSIGYTMGSNLVEQFKQLSQSELLKGFQQGLSGAEASISKEEMQKLLISFQRQAMQQRFEDLKKLAVSNKEEGDKFLAENKTKPGVSVTKSGLQYKVLSKGNGPTPKDTDRVSVNYTGKLINGEVFSTSQELGDKPAAFTLNGVIPAWREALKLMPKGSKWEIYAPASLAYGERGTHGKIGPNATLIFTIELVDVQKASSQAPKTNATSSNSSNDNANKS